MHHCLVSRSILVLFFSFSYFVSTAQWISGTLVDEETDETIPFATVQIGENYGVISNEEGNFSMSVAGFSAKDSLVFSFMGYQRKAIAIGDLKRDTVFLEQTVTRLEEVFLVENPLTALEIMQNVNKNLKNNYDNSFSHFTVFNRYQDQSEPYQVLVKFKNKRDDFLDKTAVQRINHSMDSLNNAMQGKITSYYDAQLVEIYFGKKDSVKVQLEKATKLINEEESTRLENLKENVFGALLKNLKSSNTFKVRTGIIPIADSLNMEDIIVDEKAEKIDSAFASPDSYRQDLTDFGFGDNKGLGFVTKLGDYEYSIDGISKFNGEWVYKISFVPDRGLFAGNGKMAGNLYVSADSFAVLMANYRFAEGEHGTKVNLKFIAGFSFEEKEKSGKIIFQKKENGKYIPKFIRKQSKQYVYFDRNFVFKENDRRKDRMKVKFEMTIEMDVEKTQEWLVVAHEPISQQDFDKVTEKTKTVVEKTKTYNPEIWKDYNILAPTKAIKEYEY